MPRALWGFGRGLWLEEVGPSGCGDRFAAKHGRVRRLNERSGRSATDWWRDWLVNPAQPMRAWALPAESRQEWRASLRSSIGGDGIMRCRS